MILLYIKPLFDESPIAVIVVGMAPIAVRVIGMQVKLVNSMKLWAKLNFSQNIQF